MSGGFDFVFSLWRTMQKQVRMRAARATGYAPFRKATQNPSLKRGSNETVAMASAQGLAIRFGYREEQQQPQGVDKSAQNGSGRARAKKTRRTRAGLARSA